MDEHRSTDTVRSVGGKVEEGVGRTGDAHQSESLRVMDKAQGAAEKLYGQAIDAASDAAEGVRKTAVSFEDTLHHTIQNKPYTAVVMALGVGVGLGWLLGRVQQPRW